MPQTCLQMVARLASRQKYKVEKRWKCKVEIQGFLLVLGWQTKAVLTLHTPGLVLFFHSLPGVLKFLQFYQFGFFGTLQCIYYCRIRTCTRIWSKKACDSVWLEFWVWLCDDAAYLI